MTSLSLSLILLSAFAHSTWNFLLKRAGDQEVFVWCLLVTASVLLLPIGAVLFWLYPFKPAGWWFILATTILHIGYFVFLGRAYARGDLSMVYPIARGIAPMLVPILAVVILKETIAAPAVIGIVAIVTGIYIVSWSGQFHRFFRQPSSIFRNPGAGYAILTGLVIAAYAIVDKWGVGHVQPFLYMYLMTVGAGVGLSPYILVRFGTGAVAREWRANARPILAAGVLTFIGYGLVLTAFSLSKVSYVAPAREVGIVVGVLMGVFILKEPFGIPRIVGSSVIILGLALIALSP